MDSPNLEAMTVDPGWLDEFDRRMRHFAGPASPDENSVPVSVKVRITSGCFHREHSPEAYRRIDSYLERSAPSDVTWSFEEHESGPEIHLWLAATTAGFSFAKSVVDLITAIVKARAEGIKKGDRPSAPVEIIIRLVDDREYRETKVIQLDPTDRVDAELIERALNQSLDQLSLPEPRKPNEST
ncbi:MAG: hypothetical protein Rubg2KO_06800 [Rubricoccaceae bacterium]